MKRSEMLSILLGSVYDNIGAYGEYSGLMTDNVHKILEDLEVAGMAPPEVPEPCQTYFVDATGRQMQGEDSTVFVRKWEDEA